MKGKKIKIVNEFHNTEVNVIAFEHEGELFISKNSRRRANKILCGMSDCSCQNFQNWIIDHYPDRDGDYRIY